MTAIAALVVLGLSPTGLYVIREAVHCGAEVLGFSDTADCGARSRYLSNADPHLPGGDAPLKARLGALASRYDRLAVIPTTDRHVEWLVQALPELPDNVQAAASYRGTDAGKFLSKDWVNAAALATGLQVPDERSADEHIPGREDFPLILKPRSIHRERHWLRGRKLFLCDSTDDWKRVTTMPGFEPESWIVQSLVHGPESNIQVAAVWRGADGATECFTGRKLRQHPVNFGSASLLASDRDEEIEAAALTLLEHLDFQGIAGVEFKRDARDGAPRFIELNPRPSLWFAAATAHGEFLVHRQLAEWWGEGVQPPALQPSSRVTWRYALKDRFAALAHRRAGGSAVLPLPDISPAEAGTTCWAVHDPADPGPARAELANYARKALKRLRP